ncbi:MAG: hypothetical protein H6662_02665 [Ardenticatenaceae bacterium]|nr:hypothetical protein [Ardenticatenaceae bacterium]MCB8989417.1 hypothetical protein [Ardenticatenaceae bacterium]MCB9004572.1 hypothetical protein [Ardenticatenaceae bacterium]
MHEQLIDTSETPHVMLTRCGGDVTIATWQRKAVAVSGEGCDVETPEVDVVQVGADTAVSLRIPPHSRLTIGDVSGNLTIKHVAGLVSIGQVTGDLRLATVGNVQAKSAAKLHGEGIDGPLTVTAVTQTILLRNTRDVAIEQAGGDVSIRYANGDVALGRIGGRLDLRTISGSLTVKWVDGTVYFGNLGGQVMLSDVRSVVHLVGGLMQGEHTITGSADLFVYWPTGAALSLTAEAAQIRNGLKLRSVTETTSEGLTTLTGYLKDFKTALRLHTPARIGLLPWDGSGEPDYADGDVLFAPPPEPAAEPAAVPVQAVDVGMGTAVSRAVAEVLTSIELELGPEWKHRFAALELEKRLTEAIAAELQSDLTAALATTPAAAPVAAPPAPTAGIAAFRQAEQAVQKSLQQAEESMEVTRARAAGTAAEEEAGDVETAVPTPPANPTQQTPAQLRILDLLEKGAITVEQASQLLQAL